MRRAAVRETSETTAPARPADHPRDTCSCVEHGILDGAIDVRCMCGALLGRRAGDAIELSCRRCKRRVVLLVKEVRS
jgi:hypothetical protein